MLWEKTYVAAQTTSRVQGRAVESRDIRTLRLMDVVELSRICNCLPHRRCPSISHAH